MERKLQINRQLNFSAEPLCANYKSEHDMKHILIVITLIVLLSCQKDNIEPTLLPTSIENLDLGFTKICESDSYNSVYFVDTNTGFVAGYNGAISKTIDGGYNWISLESNTSITLYDIYFLNASEGFVVGGESGCGGTGCIPEGGIILYTNDGGQTWGESYRPQKKIEIRSIYFINESKGFAVGNNIILSTIDKGVTWEETEIEGLDGIMTDIRFANENFGIISCLFDNLLVTTDGGNNWQIVKTTNGIGYYSLSAINETKSFISGQGKIYTSNNIRQTWSELNNSPSDIFDMYFTNELEGFAFGRGNYSGGDFGYSYGSIYHTIDGGAYWTGSSNVHETGVIESVSFPSNKKGYALSQNILIRITAE